MLILTYVWTRVNTELYGFERDGDEPEVLGELFGVEGRGPVTHFGDTRYGAPFEFTQLLAWSLVHRAAAGASAQCGHVELSVREGATFRLDWRHGAR